MLTYRQPEMKPAKAPLEGISATWPPVIEWNFLNSK